MNAIMRLLVPQIAGNFLTSRVYHQLSRTLIHKDGKSVIIAKKIAYLNYKIEFTHSLILLRKVSGYRLTLKHCKPADRGSLATQRVLLEAGGNNV